MDFTTVMDRRSLDEMPQEDRRKGYRPCPRGCGRKMSRNSGICQQCWLSDLRAQSQANATERADLHLRIDRETYEEIRARARRQGIGIAEQIRELIEWGLEAERETYD